MVNNAGEEVPEEFAVALGFQYGAFAKFFEDKYTPAANVMNAGALNTLRPRAMSFTYLDCGRWGGRTGTPNAQRCFGLIWGRWVALCEFVSAAGPVPIVGATPDSTDKQKQDAMNATGPLNEILKALCSAGPSPSSVRILKSLWTPPEAPVPPSDNVVQVILPDFHLPVVTHEPDFQPVLNAPPFASVTREYQSDGPQFGRDYWPRYQNQGAFTSETHGYTDPISDDEGMETLGNFFTGLCDNALHWFDLYKKNNIYSGASGDLNLFLKKLGTYNNTQYPLRLVHLGDMYELWNGLGRFYEENTTNTVQLRGLWGISANDFLKNWVTRANNEFVTGVGASRTRVIDTFKQLNVEKVWLWGNHDCYLANVSFNDSNPGEPYLPARVRQIRKDGFFIEHGHRGDDSNRDGTITGYYAANRLNFATGNALRPFELLGRILTGQFDPRADQVRAAAEEFLSGKDFSVYVQGHTHQPYLTRVTIVEDVRDSRSNRNTSVNMFSRSSPPAPGATP